MKLGNLAKAAPFAHLMGIKPRAEDETEEEKKAKKAKRAEDEKDEDKEKEAKKAEDEKDERDAEESDDGDGDEDKDEKKSKKAKKAKAEEKDDEDDKEEADEEDGDEEMKGNSASAKARRRERARCAAIFRCDAAGARPDVAAHLAFETTLARADAIALLKSVASGSTGKRALTERMAGVKVPNVGAEGSASVDPNDPKAVAARIIAAGKKARGEQ